jgi:hypothetical protein
MSNITLIIVVVIAVVVIVTIVIVGYQIMARQRRTRQLREQYGPEYDRAVDLADSQREAESELRGRSKRHEQLELRSLDSSERENFERCWSDIQGQFVDGPSTAVRNADLLVVEVMSARGYPVEDFDQRAKRFVCALPGRYPALSGRAPDCPGKRVRNGRHRGSSPSRDVLPVVGVGLADG